MRIATACALLAQTALIPGLAGIGCARSSLAREHRYLLGHPSRELASAQEAAPALIVGPLRGEGLARGTQIWTRISPIEVEPWQTHQWALPAPEVVARAVVEWARASGRFREAAIGEVAGPGPIWRLDGTLEALEQEEGPEGWSGRVRLRLVLEEFAPGGRSVLWRGTLDERALATARHPAAVVAALGQALVDGLDRAAAGWSWGSRADSEESTRKASGPPTVQGPFPVLMERNQEGEP